MLILTAEDQKHVTAAEGWLDLGHYVAAFDELENVEPLHRAHPDVLKLRWRIYAKAEKWESAFELAEGLTRMQPDDAEPFVFRSYAARRMNGGGVSMAFELLRDVANDFPDAPTIAFNLACYAAQLHQLIEAREWLERAMASAEKVGQLSEYRLLSLNEPDLKPLRLSADR